MEDTIPEIISRTNSSKISIAEFIHYLIVKKNTLTSKKNTQTSLALYFVLYGKKKLQDKDVVSDWFLVDLIAALKAEGKKLDMGQVYSYKKLIVLGGDYSLDNFVPTDIEVHFSFAGQIHQQVKDLPPGTKINSVKFVPNND